MDWKNNRSGVWLLLGVGTVLIPVLFFAPLRAIAQTASPGASASTAPAGAPRIVSFEVTGNHILNSAYIIATSGAKVGQPFTPELQNQMIQNLLASGYFGTTLADSNNNPVIVEAEEPSPPNGTCKVLIEVHEYPVVKNITLTGSGPIKPQFVLKFFQNMLPSAQMPNPIFNASTFITDYTAAQDYYTKQGYTMQVGAEVNVDKNGILQVPLIVPRVSSIKIDGLHKTRKYVVTRELHTKPGSYFNIRTLRRDQESLLNLGIFDNVQVAPVQTGPAQYAIDINIKEKRTGSITGGVGYSPAEHIIGYAEAVDTNFRGTGETLSLRASTGGALGRNSVELGFIEPYLDSHHTSLSMQLYDKTVYRFSNGFSSFSGVSNTTFGGNSYYNEQHTGGYVSVGRPFSRYVNGSLFFRGETIRTDLLNLPLADLQIIQNGPVFTLGTSFSHDTRDYYLNPAKGGVQTLSIEAGHANLQAPVTIPGIFVPGVYGSANFLRFNLEARQYISLSGQRPPTDPTKDETVLALRAVLGASTGTLPFAEQFFLGGGDTLRGYRDARFWGKYELLTSVELRQPLARRFVGVLFVDAGDAWGGKYSNVNINNFQQGGFRLHLGTGLGVLVQTPIGALRLDYGFGDEGGRADFSIGQSF